jgi:ribosomal protein L19
MKAPRVFPLFIGLFMAGHLFASGVRGTVSNQDGRPLEYATIFVKETGSGAVANENGYFEIRLEPGAYTLIFQYLGYQTISRRVDVRAGFLDMNIIMIEQPLELKVVEVYEGREDPAYTVMRRAIAKASYHRQQLDSYEAQVYIKGSGRLKNAPFFLRKAIEKEGIDSTVAFVSESVSRIYYERPNTFREKVISIRTQGDDNNTSPNSYIFGSFYQPEVAEAISPLSTKAFAYYKFELEGFFLDRGYGVNKIKVTPRSRGENVFEGSIYIVEDYWSIYSLKLSSYKFGIKFNLEQVYAPIEDKAWLPVSHQINVDGKVLGFAFEYNYLATVGDYKIKLNPDLDYDFAVIDEKIQKELAAELEKQKKEQPKAAGAEQKLAAGQELTRKDLRKLMRDYEKEERSKDEEPEVVQRTEFKIDSLASKRDSLYWAEIRPVPLNNYEVRGYQRVDSLAKVEAMEKEQDSLAVKTKSGKGFNPMDIVGGRSYKVGKDKYLSHESIWDKVNFNPVEGFNIWTTLAFSAPKGGNLKIGLTPRYAFSREKASLKGNIGYSFGEGDKRGRLSLEGGRYIFQYNEKKPISELFNTYLNLVQERNYIRLYEKEYARAGLAQRLAENYTLRISAEWAQRFTLENTTTQTWLNRDDRTYDSNIPANDEVELPLLNPERAAFFSIALEGRPWQKYKIRNNKKSPIDNTSPTIGLEYRKGLAGLLNSDVNYDRLEATFQHKFRIGVRGTVDMKVETGLFLNNEYVGFADYKHFMGNRIALVSVDPVGSFRLLDYYRHSTSDKWAAVHVHYQFRKLLFTQIPEVWLMGIKENVFVNYLAAPTSQNYFEAGYSIDNIFRVFRIEAALAFQNGKYYDWGILVGIASNLGDFTIN